jgi:hypothetical protein
MSLETSHASLFGFKTKNHKFSSSGVSRVPAVAYHRLTDRWIPAKLSWCKETITAMICHASLVNCNVNPSQNLGCFSLGFQAIKQHILSLMLQAPKQVQVSAPVAPKVTPVAPVAVGFPDLFCDIQTVKEIDFFPALGSSWWMNFEMKHCEKNVKRYETIHIVWGMSSVKQLEDEFD